MKIGGKKKIKVEDDKGYLLDILSDSFKDDILKKFWIIIKRMMGIFYFFVMDKYDIS